MGGHKVRTAACVARVVSKPGRVQGDGAARAWSLEASMPMFRAMARTTVGPAPVKRPPMPSCAAGEARGTGLLPA